MSSRPFTNQLTLDIVLLLHYSTIIYRSNNPNKKSLETTAKMFY